MWRALRRLTVRLRKSEKSKALRLAERATRLDDFNDITTRKAIAFQERLKEDSYKTIAICCSGL
jgi:hypothetical protein